MARTSHWIVAVVFLFGCAGKPVVNVQITPNAHLPSGARVAVIPSEIGGEDSMLLSDLIATDLLGSGINIVERTTVAQLVHEAGLDLTEILRGREYFKLGTLANVDVVVLTNQQVVGRAIAVANARAVDTATGKLLLSANYEQPEPDNEAYFHHESITETAARLAAAIAPGLSGR